MKLFNKWNLVGSVVAYIGIHIALIFFPPAFSQHSLFKAGAGIPTLISIMVLGVMVVGWGFASTAVSRAAGRASFAKNGGGWIWNSLKNWGRHQGGIHGWLINRIQWRDSKAKYPFHRLRLELNVLINYLLRLEVYTVKSKYVAEVQKFVQEEIDEKFEFTYSTGQQKSDYIEYMAGYGYKYDAEKATWTQEDRVLEFVSSNGHLTAKVPGQCGAKNRHILVAKCMESMNRYFDRVRGGTFKPGSHYLPENLKRDLQEELATIRDELELEGGGKTLPPAKKSLMRYGLSQYKDSLRWAILDMNNRNGWYKHPYKFASIIARPWICTARIERKGNGEIKIKEELIDRRVRERREIGDRKGGKFGAVERFMWETDSKGRFMDDINKIIIEKKQFVSQTGREVVYGDISGDEVRYRKVDGEDIYQCDELGMIASAMTSSEWAFFKDDFNMGYLHPKSRTWRAYEDAHNDRDWSYRHLSKKWKTPLLAPKEGAFDREALKDPGKFQYRGRKAYYDEVEEELKDNEPINKYPCVSLLGLADYIIDLVKKTLKEEEQPKFFKLHPRYNLTDNKVTLMRGGGGGGGSEGG